jgi:hypothetical protein
MTKTMPSNAAYGEAVLGLQSVGRKSTGTSPDERYR